MDSLSRQPDLDRLLYHSTVAVSTPNANSPALDGAGHTAQATAATVLSPEKADAPAAGEREEIQIQLVDKLQVVTSPAEAAAIGGGAGETLDATSQLEEAGAALDLAQRRALLLGRTKQRHVCLQCGRECPSKHKLKRHLSTHSEQRPYNCHLCGKSFKWTEYLAKHMRTQHPGVEGTLTVVYTLCTPQRKYAFFHLKVVFQVECLESVLYLDPTQLSGAAFLSCGTESVYMPKQKVYFIISVYVLI